MDASDVISILFGLLVDLAMFGASIAAYVLGSLGAYTIAKRRGIHNPWLAWLPVGSEWIWGCISDQYQYVVKGKNTNRRKILLVMNILLWISLIVFFVQVNGMMINIFSDLNAVNSMTDAQVAQMMLGFVGQVLLVWLVMLVVSIVMTVFQYIVLYDLYRSCDPDNSALYLILSIVVSVTAPFLIFVCRNKDLGMPPRKEPDAPAPAGAPE